MGLGIRKSDVKKAIEKSGGIVSTVAKRLKCDWHTAKKHIVKFKMDAMMVAEKESLLDLAESKLISNIQDGDNTAIIFFLKTQGKERGYIERNEMIAKLETDNIMIMLPTNNRDKSNGND